MLAHRIFQRAQVRLFRSDLLHQVHLPRRSPDHRNRYRHFLMNLHCRLICRHPHPHPHRHPRRHPHRHPHPRPPRRPRHIHLRRHLPCLPRHHRWCNPHPPRHLHHRNLIRGSSSPLL